MPEEIIIGATAVEETAAKLLHAGPADAVPDGDLDVLDPSNEAQVGGCAAAVDGGSDSLSPLMLWDEIMRKYGVAQQCERAIQAVNSKQDPSEKERLNAERWQAVAAAVQALARLKNQDMQKKLDEFRQAEEGNQPPLQVGHSKDMMSNFDSIFWPYCFVDLFCRGDCLERCDKGVRRTHVPEQRWVKALLTRADCREWRMDFEFVACAYNVLLRRSQIRAVQMTMRSVAFSKAHANALQETTASDLVAHALASGDCNSVAELLRHKGLDEKLRTTFQFMQMAQRKVRGSEAQRSSVRYKFRALRLWQGCSSLFFTLNPHDIRSPLTIVLSNREHFQTKTFSLDLPDSATEQFLTELLGESPRKLHEMAAQDPLAATKCFHYTVRLTIEALFNCVPPGKTYPDGLPSHTEPGVFGHVAAYLGVVEPQMRKALHIHMLIQLLGFAHPEDIFGSGRLQDVFRRFWYFAASICFRSSEAFGVYMHEATAQAVLAQEPLLPITKKQRDMIGQAQAQASIAAQCDARGLTKPPEGQPRMMPKSFFISETYGDATLSSAAWSSAAMRDVLTATAATGNHVCRSDVCHKGRIGRMGFCRMFFWHWAQLTKGSGDVGAVRRHGMPLQRRWDGNGSPPFHAAPPFNGLPALEMCHPFHYKMTPSMVLAPRCNHDLGILVRLPPQGGDAALSDRAASVQAMLDTMGDHEFYCAAYASKEQPHIEGLLHTLADSVRRLDQDVARRRLKLEERVAQGQEPDAQAADQDMPMLQAKALLNRLLSATNRRMHKGFPEMLSYLLNKPSEYCSHEFVSLPIDGALRCGIAEFKRFVEAHPLRSEHAPVRSEAIPEELPQGQVPEPTVKLYARGRPNLTVYDYEHRPVSLERFPLYFFFASCEPSLTADSESLPWATSDVHCKPTPVKSRRTPEWPLRDPSTGECIYDHDYYVRLRTLSAWRVPILYGRLPKGLSSADTAEERGVFAMFLMVLFRPHRVFEALFGSVARCRGGGSMDAAWERLFAEYVRWRKEEIDEVAATYLDRSGVGVPPPAFGTTTWWACMTALRLRNMDLVLAKHVGGEFDAPKEWE